MPKALLGTGDVMLSKKITIPKKLKMDIRIEKQAVTERCQTRDKNEVTEHKEGSTFTDSETLDRALWEKKYATESRKMGSREDGMNSGCLELINGQGQSQEDWEGRVGRSPQS